MSGYKLGDTLELALWYNGDRLTEKDAARHGIRKAHDIVIRQGGLVTTPLKWGELAPGDERVPEPPRHFAGSPRLMVGTADILAIRPGLVIA
jgi:hypothetical protein